MIKKYVYLIGIWSALSAHAASSNHTVSGKVKKFDPKIVQIEVDGHPMEFDVARVVDKKKLRFGEMVEIDVDRKVSK